MAWQIEEMCKGPYRNGIVRNMPDADYREAKGISPSWLVEGLKSMKHLRFPPVREPTPNMLIGSLAHCMVLEPEEVDSRYAVCNVIRNKRHKAYQEWLEEHDGCEAVKNAEWQQALSMASAVRRDPMAKDILRRCSNPEASIFCEDFGVQCKGRVDQFGPGLLVDVKTTPNIEMHAFGRVFANLNYAARLACYARWLGKCGVAVHEVYLITVENQFPFDVAVVPVPMPILENAWPRIEKILKAIPECVERHRWPGVANGGLYELHVPTWSMPEEEILDWSTTDV